MALLNAQHVWKHYAVGQTPVLRGASLEIGAGDFITIYGASGSGKSSLLHILGGLDRPSRGTVTCEKRDLYTMSDASLARFRNQTVGFVFQFYYLLPELTALENVMLPCLLGGHSSQQARCRAQELLDHVGLAAQAAQHPATMSGGEQQRVAIARALAQAPRVLLADEPTGNLDATMGTQVMTLLRGQGGHAVVMVTHNPALRQPTDRTYELREGVLHAWH